MNDAGNEFAKLLVRHDSELRRYIATFVHQRCDVEEILQETAVVMWQKFAEYDRERNFLPWAIRCAYFEVLNFRKLRARSRLTYSDEVILALAETREELSEDLKQRQIALQTCLTKLPEEDRCLLQRRYSDSSSVRSLSEESGRTAKALYRRLDRVRAALSACVNKKLLADSPQ